MSKPQLLECVKNIFSDSQPTLTCFMSSAYNRLCEGVTAGDAYVVAQYAMCENRQWCKTSLSMTINSFGDYCSQYDL